MIRLAVLALLLTATTAQAATIHQAKAHGYHRLEYQAAPGEVNHVRADWTAVPGKVRVTDTAPLKAGKGCASVSAHTAVCALGAGKTETWLSLDLGDRDDTSKAIEGDPGDSTKQATFTDGQAGADRLKGGYVISGGDGDDVLVGGQATQLMNGDDGDDRVTRDVGILPGDEAPQLGGGAGDDVLTGGPGGETLEGDLGTDTLHGAGGDDVLYEDNDHGEGLGDDRDVYDGGPGDDLVSYLHARDAITVDLSDPPDGSNGQDAFTSIEGIGGGNGDDTLTALPGGSRLLGGDGKDRLTGLGGDDTLDGQYGADTIVGGDGDDDLRGDRENDTIDAGPGDDTLHGDKGADMLGCGEGSDTVIDANRSELITPACEHLAQGLQYDFQPDYRVQPTPAATTADGATFAFDCPSGDPKLDDCAGTLTLTSAPGGEVVGTGTVDGHLGGFPVTVHYTAAGKQLIAQPGGVQVLVSTAGAALPPVNPWRIQLGG